MNPRTEDLLGKALMVAAFGFFAGRSALGLAAALASPDRPPFWPLGLVAQALSLVFVAIVLLFTIRRLPPRASAAGLEPRLTAIAGTFALLLLLWLPPGKHGPVIELAATLLLLTGTAASIWCLHFLGRSFSIMASARELVTHGPYAIVRHPLYLAEAISTLGIILLHWSALAALVGAIQMALQFRRMHNEETILRAAFPDYAAYAARVPMLVPFRTAVAR